MKKTIILIIALFIASTGFSQDFIYLKDGTLIQGFIREANNMSIVYTYSENSTDNRISINTDRVVKIVYANGYEKEYGNPDCKEDYWRKIWESVDAVLSGGAVACGVADSLAQTVCMNGVQESVKEISTFPEQLIQNITQDNNKYHCVDGLGEVLERCYELGVLPAELTDIPWARSGTIVDLLGYNNFPSWENYDF